MAICGPIQAVLGTTFSTFKEPNTTICKRTPKEEKNDDPYIALNKEECLMPASELVTCCPFWSSRIDHLDLGALNSAEGWNWQVVEKRQVQDLYSNRRNQTIAQQQKPLGSTNFSKPEPQPCTRRIPQHNVNSSHSHESSR